VFRLTDHEMGHIGPGNIKSAFRQSAVSDAVFVPRGTVGEPWRAHDGPVEIGLAGLGLHPGHVGNHLAKQGGFQDGGSQAEARK